MQTLGLSDSTPKGGSRLRELFWPKVEDEVAAVTAARNAMYASFWIAASSAFFALAGGSGWLGWIDVAIYVLVGIGVRQLSRAAALIGFILYGLSWLAVLVAQPKFSGYMGTVQMGSFMIASLVRLILTVLLFHGVRAAAFIHMEHREETVDQIANPDLAGLSGSEAFWERLPKRVWPLVRIPFFLVLSLLLLLNLMTLSAATIVQQWVQAAGSMENTLLTGDHVISLRRVFMGEVRRGDLVVLRYPVQPNTVLLKRVVGVPGDHIRIADKQLYLNGSRVNEPYAKHATDYVDSYRDQFPSEPSSLIFPGAKAMLRDHVQNGEVVVPAGQYFVLGDNRDMSLDSRYWGFVPAGYILGRPILVAVSYDHDVRRAGRVMLWLARFPLGTT